MKLFCCVVCFFIYIVLHAQVDTVSVHRDTLNTVISDTLIIYYIQEEPVTIVEKIEIRKPKDKKEYYLELFAAPQLFIDIKKARNNSSYLSKMDSLSEDLNAYSAGVSLFRFKKKKYSGVSLSFTRFRYKFHYTDVKGNYGEATNRFNYLNLSLQAGYKISKKNYILVPYGELQICELLSMAGFALQKENPLHVFRSNTILFYRKYNIALSIGTKFIWSLKGISLNIEPFITGSPFSYTAKDELYVQRRITGGIKIGIVNFLL